MKSVDYHLKPASAGSAWEELLRHSYICHRCQKIFKAVSDELYFFPDDDATYHRHPDSAFYRAFTIRPDGGIEIGAFDSVEENVIQAYAFTLDGKGGQHTVGGTADLHASSKAFFEAMKRQNRRVAPADFRMEFGL